MKNWKVNSSVSIKNAVLFRASSHETVGPQGTAWNSNLFSPGVLSSSAQTSSSLCNRLDTTVYCIRIWDKRRSTSPFVLFLFCFRREKRTGIVVLLLLLFFLWDWRRKDWNMVWMLSAMRYDISCSLKNNNNSETCLLHSSSSLFVSNHGTK